MNTSSATPSAFTPESSVRERFHRLAAEWKEQSRFLSNSAQMAMLRPYQRIIGMGPPVVPLILEELAVSRTTGSGPWNRSPKKTLCRLKPWAKSA